jgi:hypothetical protein
MIKKKIVSPKYCREKYCREKYWREILAGKIGIVCAKYCQTTGKRP